jgi:integrase
MSKRTAGEGSIRKRTRGGRPDWWEARVYYYEGGVRKRRYIFGRTQSEARNGLREAQAQLEKGTLPSVANQTMAQFLTSWLPSVEARLKPRTFATYSTITNNYLIPSLGHMKLAALTPMHVNRYIANELKAGMAPRTVHHHRSVLKTALKDAMKHDLLMRNAAALSDAVRTPRHQVRPMNFEEAQSIIEAVAGSDLEGPVNVAIYLGLRSGEVFGLQWSDIDFVQQELNIERALQRLDGEFRFVTPKSATSVRTLPIPKPLVSLLKNHKKREQSKRREQQLPALTSKDLVFTDPFGEPIDANSVTRRMNLLLTKVKLRPRRFHDLRHGAATLLLASGVDIKTVSTMLGHSTIGITADLYASVLPNLKRNAANLMGERLPRRSKRAMNRTNVT